MHVPENWEAPDSNMIKVAVIVLKSLSEQEKSDPVVFIQGGPGADAISRLRLWDTHPLRNDHDIVIFDPRGTGFSEPRLCPDLGKKIFRILAKDQSEQKDEDDKAAAALICKQEMLNRNINVYAYNSWSMARDLHSIMAALNYNKWNVYGVSYGTHVAQVYASLFPEDISSLVLDSFIPDITNYYVENTTNYVTGLEKVFSYCENDPACAASYPDLENIYYETIADLKKNPITVEVGEEMVDSGKFTYNAEDFKVAIQQALYQKQLIEIIPLLISEFHNRNEAALSNLVEAFSALLDMDYGVYFSVTCNEAIPNNQYDAYLRDAKQYSRLSGGISFYKSDFIVCDRWNQERPDSSTVSAKLVDLRNATFPVLLFSGEYDPITPPQTAEVTEEKFAEYQYIHGYSHGHIPGFTENGKQLAQKFIENPTQMLNSDSYKNQQQVSFASGVQMNAGIAEMGSSLNERDIIFLAPLLIALILMMIFIITYTIKSIKNRYSTLADRIIRALGVVLSITGLIGVVLLILAISEVMNQNYYILAFGLPSEFNYIFDILQVFTVLLIITFLFFIVKIKKLKNRSVIFSLLFSNIVLVTYLLYWNVI
jgi:pimeloyl-ACP methyl ester carboxylesterase